MNSIFFSFRNLGLAALLSLGLSPANVAWSAPSIQSIEVSPNPLTTGQTFTIDVTTSPDVTRATATVFFRGGEPRFLQVPLTKQGLTWTGSGIVPANLRLQLPTPAGAMVKVTAFDAARRLSEGVVHLGVKIESISAVFADGILIVSGDDQDNTITVSRDAVGAILVNDGAVPVTGSLPTVGNTALIRMLGIKGNDILSIDEVNGPMPPANLLGGEGNDTLTGSANIDELDGGPDDDALSGRGGDDRLVGGSGKDTLTGGPGADQFFGGEGDDQIVWLPGDGSDLVEGEDGQDTLEFVGSNGSETVDLSTLGHRFQFFRTPGNITMDCDGVEEVTFRAAAGNDAVTVGDLAGTQVRHVGIDLFSSGTNAVVINGTGTNDLITVTGSTNGVDIVGLTAAVTVVGAEQDLDRLVINALAENDSVDASAMEAGAIELTLNGGAGNDTLNGGQGNDLIIGGQGLDLMLGEAGDDTFLWNPGDGSDVIEGEAGEDSMLFNGANVAENIEVSANGQRLRFFRSPGNITMDCDEVEVVQFNAFGGADLIIVDDLSRTSVTRLNLDLANPATTGLGDTLADTVIIAGTSASDAVTIKGTPAGVDVLGLSAAVNIVGSDPTIDQLMDQLIISLLGDNDVAEASNLQGGVITLTVSGGTGNDVLIGSAGADTLLGDEGDDVLEGGPGVDVLDGGAGDNILIQD